MLTFIVSSKMFNNHNELSIFSKELISYLHERGLRYTHVFGVGKDILVTSLYKRRGKLAKRLMHSSMAGITAFGVLVAPIVAQEFPLDGELDVSKANTPTAVLSVTSSTTDTIIGDREYRDSIITYIVQEGDTVSSISQKFGISTDTIRWANDLQSKDSIKIGQELDILPITGIFHKVKKGDTVYSIAKRYDIDAQGVVNYPFNSFVNDETFELAIGQVLMVPEGVMPSSTPWSPSSRVRQVTPDAGTVVASGQFAWPTQGTITQNFYWYHKGIDIANRSAPAVVAADAGRVIVAGWPDNYGYGNRVIVDHGNGYRTLYAHLSRIHVVVGQTVNRGDQLGVMGNTGRSTGTHLHFEISRNGVHLSPLGIL